MQDIYYKVSYNEYCIFLAIGCDIGTYSDSIRDRSLFKERLGYKMENCESKTFCVPSQDKVKLCYPPF